MNKKLSPAIRQPIVSQTEASVPIRYGRMFSPIRQPNRRQVLTVTLWYIDGTTDEMFITSPHIPLIAT